MELILVPILLFLGISIIMLASHLGKRIFNMSMEIDRGLSESRVWKFLNGKWMMTWSALERHFGQSYDIWMLRIIGMVIVAGAILLLFAVLFAS
jgi:hypothetical protein